MPSGPSDSSSRNWWPLSKPDVQEKASRSSLKSSGLSFNSIASAIGLKSKKQRPSIAIQDPPPALLASSSGTTLPPHTRSRVDSTGPLTPVDYQHDECQSLPTLTDTDPFAGQSIIIPPVSQFPKIPLSVDTSVIDRISCASCSSLSTGNACDTSTLSSAAGQTESQKLFNKPSIKNIQFFRSAGFTDPMIRQSSLSSKRPGSSTVVAGSQTPFALPRKMRARGMTDGGGTQKAGFFSAERPALSQKSSISTFSPMPSTEHNPPRVAIQQPCSSRLFAPPCAPPPIHSLPATPHSPTKIFSPMQKSARFDRTESISSSSISFVSSSSNEMFPVPSFTMREKGTSDRSVFSQDYDPEISPGPAKPESKTAPSSPRVLKKTISHQSLGKSSVLLPTSSKLPPDNMMEKVFRKQRSFHRTRSPMPPISDPLDRPISPISTTFSSSNGSGPKAEVTTEQRREKGNCSLSIGRRKRLFSHSGSPRPSTSQCTPISATTEDDSQSVFSLRSDRSCHLVSFKPWTPQAAPQSSFWDESGSPVPSSPSRSTPDYMPQPILSPAEVAKLEASIENSSHRSSRRRALSLLSTLTAASDREDVETFPAGLSPPPTARPRSKQGSMTGKSSTVRTPALYSPVSSRARSPASSPPSPNKGNPESDSRSMTMYQPSESPMTSLPPPPRSRQRSLPPPNPENDARSTIPYRPSESPTLFTTSLPPPPRSRQRSQLISHPGHRGPVPLRSNSFSIAKRSRSKSAAEKDTHHRSIMRKSSFLEIDDDTDQDIDMFSGKAITESFLDFAKESFEASRSDDS